MINVTRLYCGLPQPNDALRYGCGPGVPKSASERRPVVVWNLTRSAQKNSGELTTDEGFALLRDLATFKVPAVLFSGGEPLVRQDVFELASYARSLGHRLSLSSNGTLINGFVAERLKAIGFAYVGISLDGIGDTNDLFRTSKGAFKRAVAAIRHCRTVGQKVGLRMTLTNRNSQNLDAIFDFIATEGIERACFYHVVYAGREHSADALTKETARRAIDTILRRTQFFVDDGDPREILTVGNHADGPYIALKLRELKSLRAETVEELLRWNGGGAHSAGTGIADIDPQGNVHPEQFWGSANLGNIRERPFSRIWSDESNELLSQLRDRVPLLHGRCGACRHVNLCGGSSRVRALAVSQDMWGEDPACYLTPDEIAL